jgi:hypothetical protein
MALAGAFPAHRSVPAYLWLSEVVEPSAVAAACTSLPEDHRAEPLSPPTVPALPDDRFFCSRNGIYPEHFDQVVERNPFKVVYGSIYDRGLSQLLEAWLRVKAAVPEAHLTVFYGFESTRARSFRSDPPTDQDLLEIGTQLAFWIYRRAMEAAMRRASAQHLGRIGHLEVARQFLSAGIWAYPTASAETSCITAMKAQAAGAVPVVIPSGALDETVEFGVKTSTSANDYPGRRLPPQVYEEWEAAADLAPPGIRQSWNRCAPGWRPQPGRNLRGKAWPGNGMKSSPAR